MTLTLTRCKVFTTSTGRQSSINSWISFTVSVPAKLLLWEGIFEGGAHQFHLKQLLPPGELCQCPVIHQLGGECQKLRDYDPGII